MRKLWVVLAVLIVGLVMVGQSAHANGPEDGSDSATADELEQAGPDNAAATAGHLYGDVLGLDEKGSIVYSHWCDGWTFAHQSTTKLRGWGKMRCFGDVALMGMTIKLYECTRWLGFFCGRSKFVRTVATASRYGTDTWYLRFLTRSLDDGWYRAVTRHTVQGNGWRDAFTSRSNWVNVD